MSGVLNSFKKKFNLGALQSKVGHQGNSRERKNLWWPRHSFIKMSLLYKWHVL